MRRRATLHRRQDSAAGSRRASPGRGSMKRYPSGAARGRGPRSSASDHPRYQCLVGIHAACPRCGGHGMARQSTVRVDLDDGRHSLRNRVRDSFAPVRSPAPSTSGEFRTGASPRAGGSSLGIRSKLGRSRGTPRGRPAAGGSTGRFSRYPDRWNRDRASRNRGDPQHSAFQRHECGDGRSVVRPTRPRGLTNATPMPVSRISASGEMALDRRGRWL